MKIQPGHGWKMTLGAWLLGVAGAMTVAACADTALDSTPATEQSGRLDNTPRMAVISAFAPELTLLRQSLQDAKEHTVNGVVFTTGTLQGQPVVLFLSGISMVNATMNTQLAIDRFNLSHVLFSGIAGGVSAELNIGDVNVPERWAQHLEVIMAREVAPGVYETPPGEHKLDAPNYGMLHHRGVGLPSTTDAQPKPQFWFQVDPELLAAAHSIENVSLQACDTNTVCLREPPRLVVGGNGLSGPAFVDNASYREHLASAFQANVVDMESAACAMVAQVNKVPFLAFRSVSDLAGGGPDANEMPTFLNIAAENSARVLMAFLAQWQQQHPEHAAAKLPAGASPHN